MKNKIFFLIMISLLYFSHSRLSNLHFLTSLAPFNLIFFSQPAFASKKPNLTTQYNEFSKSLSNKNHTKHIQKVLELLHKDPSNYAIELFYEIYKKNQTLYDLEIKKLSTQDQKFFHSCLQVFEEESKNGNG